MTRGRPIIRGKDIVDNQYRGGYWRQEEKYRMELSAIRAALAEMSAEDKNRVTRMAEILAHTTSGIGEPTALIILFRIGAFLYINSRR